MITGIDPKVDYAFKKIFGSEANAPILVDLLNAVLNPPEARRIVAVTIQNPFNDKDQLDEKLSVVDVKARDQLGRLYNVEMQMCATPTYPERVLYYWAKMYGTQLTAGDGYEKLKATISISFLNDPLFPEVADFHLDFQLRCSRHPSLLFSALQWMHVIELPKFRKAAAELANAFDGWCYFLKNAADLDPAALPAGLQTPAVQQAMEVLTVISKVDLERERYEARLRLERDQRDYVQTAENAVKKAENAEKKAENAVKKAENAVKKAEDAEKKAENAEKKAENAEKKGLVDRILLCQRFLKAPLTSEADLYALSIQELKVRAKTWEDQLLAKS